MLPTKILAGQLYMYRRDLPPRWRWLAMEYRQVVQSWSWTYQRIPGNDRWFQFYAADIGYSHYWSNFTVEMVAFHALVATLEV